MYSDITIDGSKIETPTLTFNSTNNWVMRITNDGEIIFNEELKLNQSEFAKEVIRLIEEYNSTKISYIKQIVNSDEYKNTDYKKFASEEARDFVKARLFDKICKIF